MQNSAVADQNQAVHAGTAVNTQQPPEGKLSSLQGALAAEILTARGTNQWGNE